MYLNNRCLQTQGGMEKKDAEASRPVNLSLPLPGIPAHLGRFAYGRTSTARDAKLSRTYGTQILFFYVTEIIVTSHFIITFDRYN